MADPVKIVGDRCRAPAAASGVTALAPPSGVKPASGLEQSRSSTGAGRLFVCGDIHGCLRELNAELERVNFDRSKDRLIALGDLVDRGPESAATVRLLDEPWFDSILGNHEELMMEAAKGNGEMHVINGGGWFCGLDEAERAELVERVRRLPVAMTVRTPSGRKIGLVHADFPGSDWDDFAAKVETPAVRDFALWNRGRISEARYGGELEPVRGVDHVYFGHTPLREPLTVQNMSWIDTGCFATKRLTMVELV